MREPRAPTTDERSCFSCICVRQVETFSLALAIDVKSPRVESRLRALTTLGTKEAAPRHAAIDRHIPPNEH